MYIFTQYKTYEIWPQVAFEALCFLNGEKYREPHINFWSAYECLRPIPKFDVVRSTQL